MKYFLSTILGLITGIVCISLFEYLSLYISPLPKGIDVQDIDSIAENMDSIPIINFILILVSYALASIIAGFVSIKIRTPNPLTPIMIIGIIFTIAGFIYFLRIPQPIWMIIAGSVIFIPMTWIGGKLGKPFRGQYSVYGF